MFEDMQLLYLEVKLSLLMNKPSVPFVCRKKATKLGGGVPSDETAKTEALCHSVCGTIKIPPCSKAIGAEQRAN